MECKHCFYSLDRSCDTFLEVLLSVFYCYIKLPFSTPSDSNNNNSNNNNSNNNNSNKNNSNNNNSNNNNSNNNNNNNNNNKFMKELLVFDTTLFFSFGMSFRLSLESCSQRCSCCVIMSRVSAAATTTITQGLTHETSAKHHNPQAKNIPYQPLLIKPIFSVLAHAEKHFF